MNPRTAAIARAHPHRTALAVVSLACALAAGACSQAESPGTVRDAAAAGTTPHLGVAAELYNRTGPSVPVRSIRVQSPSRIFGAEPVPADVLVGETIVYPQILNRYAGIERVFTDLGTEPDNYPLNSIVYVPDTAEPVAVPLAFDLPVVVFPAAPANSPVQAEGGTPLSAWTMDIEELRVLAAALDRHTNGVYNRIGYYPGWDDDFLLAYLRLAGADVRSDPESDSRVAWNEDALAAAVAALRTWPADGGPGPEAAAQFARAYGYAPWYRLLLDGRIGYRVVPFQEFLALPDRYRSRLQFRWLALDGRTAACEYPVYAAVPQSGSAEAAEAFLAWLAGPEAVGELLSASARSGLPGIHYLGGLPALPDTVRDWKEEFFPGIVFPGADRIAFPKPMPAQWDRITAEVLLPWLRNEIAVPVGDPVDTGRLRTELEIWQRLYRDE